MKVYSVEYMWDSVGLFKTHELAESYIHSECGVYEYLCGTMYAIKELEVREEI